MIKNFFVRTETIKFKEKGLNNFINYLTNTEHRNHKTKCEKIQNYINNDFVKKTLLKVTEKEDYTLKQQLLDGGISYTENAKGHYLDNDFKWKIKLNSNHSQSTVNGSEVEQTFDMPNTKIQNQLNYLKVFGEKIFNIGTYLAYANQPENLIVEKGGKYNKQRIGFTNFYSKTNSYYSWGFGRSSIRLNGNIEASINNINTELDNPQFTDSMILSKQISQINLEISPLYTYKTNKLNIEIELPINDNILFKKDKLTNSKTSTEDYFFINPRIGISYIFNPYFNTRLSYRFSQNIGDYTDFIDVYMMKNYLNYHKPSGTLNLRKNQSVSLILNYKNPINSLFINAYATYIPTEMNKSFATRFVGLQSVKTDINLRNKTNMWMGHVYIGKYISKIKTNFSITTDYNYYQSSQIQQHVQYPFNSNTVAVNFKSNTKVSDAFTIVYLCDFINNKSEISISGVKNKSSLNQFAQQVKTYYSPIKKMGLNFQLEYSDNELGKNSSVNMLFANIGATYKLKKVDFELNWNNIFNKKEYAYSLFNGLDTYSYRYGIRPMSVMLILSFKF